MRAIAAMTILLALGGAARACDADKARFAVGQSWSEALAEEARAKAGATIVRRMTPGHAYTMEFLSDRLNLRTDGSGAVASVSCG